VRRDVPAAGRADGADEPLSQVNVTPLVDVFLVLLILFMVTAPLLDNALEVELPEVTTAEPAPPSSVTLTLGAEGSLAVGDEVVTLEQALERCRAALAGDPDADVYLRADEAVPYGFVLSVLDALRRAGIARAALVVEPLAEEGAE
jgi:biopolymer transport protein ExbD